jgi:hypothetical protein
MILMKTGTKGFRRIVNGVENHYFKSSGSKTFDFLIKPIGTEL